MYSKYNICGGKRQYFGPQMADREYIFVGDDIEIKNYISCPPTAYLNIEDDKITKTPKSLHQDLKVLNASTYDFQNSNNLDDDFEFIPLSPPWGHNHNDQRHDHYHHKANEYQYPKINHQHHKSHQYKQHHHHNDHSHKYRCYKKVEDDVYFNFNIEPPSVQHKPVNKNDSSNNNYHNKYYKTASERFIGDYHHHQSLPTECLQVKSLSQKSPTFVSNQHYQHYYSYFYNQSTDNNKFGSSSGRGRKLPTTYRMPSLKNNLCTYDVQLKAKRGLTYVERNDCNDVDNNHRQRSNYVLTEKSTNNNEAVTAFNNVGQDKLAAGNYLYIKNFDTNDYKISQSLEEDSKAALLYLQKHKNKRKLRTNSAESVEHWCYNNHSGDPMDSIGKNENKINYNERQQELKTLNENLKASQKNIKLPTTPTKFNAKKYSPPSKHRRVLIYNIQSPRLSTSHVRFQRSKLKLNSEIKSGTKDLAAGLSTQENKHVVDNALILNTASYNKNLRKIVCDNNKNKDAYNSEDNKNNSEDNSDDDEDDEDFDDFDSSSDTSDTSSDSEEGYKSYAYKLTHSSDGISTSTSLESSINSETDAPSNPDALLVSSLFPNVPPYLAFSSNTKKGPEVPSDLYRILKWRVSSVMPRVVRSILANSGMRLLKKTNEWMGVWGKHMKSPCFKSIRPYQKINHLPGSFKIGRKDSCWKNLVRLMAKHGKRDFGFMPKTYIIPNDLKQLRKSWPKYAQKNVKWIIKPPAGARGTGIRVIDSWGQIPKRKPLIVQKYIERPLLINGSKFDLRLYVLVTSINPLRVFLYHNGLARFASVKYSDKSDTLNDRCMHLTNYSINKLSSNYSKNEDVNACHGHKWTIKSLWAYLSSRGVRTDLLWAALRSLVLRTILAGENSINNMIRANVESKYSCFELFGFDILLDADLIPWLLEVNISPSLHSELPLDSYVKAPLVQSVLNTALFNIPPKIAIERQREIAVEMSLPPGPICYDKRMYINYLSRCEKIKHNTFTRKNMEERDEYINAILEHLTPDDVRCLVIAEDELARCSPLERIFPTVDTYKYLKYTETPRYYNRLLDAWESRYANNRAEGIYLLRQYCEDQYHLQVPLIPTKKPLNYRTRAMMKTQYLRSALTIASSKIKWRELRRKMQIARITKTISSTTLSAKCNVQRSASKTSDEEEVETEEETVDEYFEHKAVVCKHL